MFGKTSIVLFGFVCSLGIVNATAENRVAQQTATMPNDAAIRKILVDRVENGQSLGLVVGLIGPGGSRVVIYGVFDKNDKRTPDGSTLFEIGSITKVFTSLLLADMVQQGEVSLADPVSKYLSPQVKIPERNGRAITLEELANQTSGLPRLPTNLSPKDPANPYADYSVEQLYAFLNSYQLTRNPGSQYEYSNLGVGLLGHVLAKRAGISYEELVETRVCRPLNMNSTAITLSPSLKARLAIGHTSDLQPTSNWDVPTLAGAGALRSTANDLLLFLSANLGYTQTPLAPALASMVANRHSTGVPGLEIALGWHIYTNENSEIMGHGGTTGGYSSFLAYRPKTKTGVVVLSNTMSFIGVEDIALHLLDEHRPLVTLYKEITLDQELLDNYVGRYQVEPNLIFTVTRKGDHLFARLSDQPEAELFASGRQEFFYKVVNAQILFKTDSGGQTIGLVLHQNGHELKAEKMPGPLPVAPEHHQVQVDSKIFDGYVGTYQLAPGFMLTVTREGDHLFAQATNQLKFEVFPESPQRYFYKVVEAQITFETDALGRATSLVLHQAGRDVPGKRVE